MARKANVDTKDKWIKIISKRPIRDMVINKDDQTNLKIFLEITKSVDEFLVAIDKVK